MTISGEQIQLVRQLMEDTGYGMWDCKRALENSEFDLNKAKQWLEDHKSNPLATLDTNRTWWF